MGPDRSRSMSNAKHGHSDAVVPSPQAGQVQSALVAMSRGELSGRKGRPVRRASAQWAGGWPAISLPAPLALAAVVQAISGHRNPTLTVQLLLTAALVQTAASSYTLPVPSPCPSCSRHHKLPGSTKAYGTSGRGFGKPPHQRS